ncbi:hypothetical protein P3S67_019644 [Capsicum chacoense]
MSLVLGEEETPRRLSRRRRSNRKKPPQTLDPLEEFNWSFDKCQVEDDYPIEIPKKSLYPYMEDLLKKKLSVRESALRTLVEEFETNVQSEFAREYFFTLVRRCHNCLKRGSTTEIELALQLIGLVALTLGEGDYAHEIYEDSFVFLPQVLLKSKLSHAVKVMECLSIVTLVGAKDSVDTERSMNFIWEFMSQESKHPSSVAASAISAWALLFSDVEKRSISPKKWKGLIPYLLKQLEQDDEYVNGASIEALALIFENGSLEKFSNQAEEYASIKDMKDGIMKEIKRICNGIKQDVSKILEDDYDKKTTLTFGGTRVSFTTWSQFKQINYIRRFLGYGFTNHMMENEHLHNIFRFAPATSECNDVVELCKPEFEEVAVRVFLPEIRRKDCKKRIYLSPSSLLSKGRTKLRNKHRSLAEETKAGHFDEEDFD